MYCRHHSTHFSSSVLSHCFCPRSSIPKDSVLSYMQVDHSPPATMLKLSCSSTSNRYYLPSRFKSFTSVHAVPLFVLYLSRCRSSSTKLTMKIHLCSCIGPLLAVLIEPPLDHVAVGIPAAFPKPFNVVPPDKNIRTFF